MLKFSTVMHKKSPGYEIKSVISVSHLGEDIEEIRRNLTDFRNKMEQIVPMTYKLKYNISSDELITTMKVETTAQAHSHVYRMNDFIKTTAKALGIH